MGACQQPVRSVSISNRCRDCNGSGEYTTPGPFGFSPYDLTVTCPSCDGGKVEFRERDVLERLRYVRTYGSRFHRYPGLRALAYSPVRLPADRDAVRLERAA